MSKITLHRTDEESLTVLLNDKELVSVNHDSHGWAGMEAVETLVIRLADELGIEIEHIEGEGED